MQLSKGQVAVITGAASGIGRALAFRCADLGMRVVVADIEEPALDQVATDLEARGATVLPVKTDVAQASAIEHLARQAFATFGAVHLLFNNAGVGIGPKAVLNTTAADWEWIINVNLWSVIHAVRVFTPILHQQSFPSYLVNTSSAAGVISTPGTGAYKVAKHGIVTLSETLHHELRLVGSPVRVAVFLPSFVKTQVIAAERNRPAALSNRHGAAQSGEIEARFGDVVRTGMARGMTAESAADRVLEAIKRDRFYIFTDYRVRLLALLRAFDMALGLRPTNTLIKPAHPRHPGAVTKAAP